MPTTDFPGQGLIGRRGQPLNKFEKELRERLFGDPGDLPAEFLGYIPRVIEENPPDVRVLPGNIAKTTAVTGNALVFDGVKYAPGGGVQVVTDIADGTKQNGGLALVRLGSGAGELMLYDTTDEIWRSAFPRQYFMGQLDGAGITSTSTWYVTNGGFTELIVPLDWRSYDVAGLKPQFEIAASLDGPAGNADVALTWQRSNDESTPGAETAQTSFLVNITTVTGYGTDTTDRQTFFDWASPGALTDHVMMRCYIRSNSFASPGVNCRGVHVGVQWVDK